MMTERRKPYPLARAVTCDGGSWMTERMADRFLAQFVDGYLIKDIETLVTRAEPAEGESVGACGYPLLMTLFAGIELLGALSSLRKFNDRSGRVYFRSYWERYLYPTRPRKNVGKGVYPLARHGIAHAYLVKGSILVSKRMQDTHLTRTDDEIRIDVSALAEDFLNSYPRWREAHLARHRNRVERRLREMLDDNEKKSKKQRAVLRRLPLTPRAGLPPGPPVV